MKPTHGPTTFTVMDGHDERCMIHIVSHRTLKKIKGNKNNKTKAGSNAETTIAEHQQTHNVQLMKEGESRHTYTSNEIFNKGQVWDIIEH